MCWECTECGEDNSGSAEVCEFCDTIRGAGLNAQRLAERGVDVQSIVCKASGDLHDLDSPNTSPATRLSSIDAPAKSNSETYYDELSEAAEDDSMCSEQHLAAASQECYSGARLRFADAWMVERRQRLFRELRDIHQRKDSHEQRSLLRALQMELYPDFQEPAISCQAQLLYLLVCARSEQCDSIEELKQCQDAVRKRRKQRTLAVLEVARRRGSQLAPKERLSEKMSACRLLLEKEDFADVSLEHHWECMECGEDNFSGLEVCEFCSTRRGTGLNAQRCTKLGSSGEGLLEHDSPRSTSAESSSHSKALKLNISDPNGFLCALDADCSWFVGDLKALLETRTQVPRAQQRLLLENKEVDDRATLGTLCTGKEKGRSIALLLVPYMRKYFDFEIFIEELKHSWTALKHSAPEFRRNAAVIRIALKQDSHALDYATPDLQQNQELVHLALEQDGLALGRMSVEIRSNCQLVMAAVEQNWHALQFAAMTVWKNFRIVRAALLQNVAAMEFAAPELLRNRNFILEAVRVAGAALKYASADIRADREVVVEATKTDPSAIAHAEHKLFDDPDFISALRGNVVVAKILAWRDEQNVFLLS